MHRLRALAVFGALVLVGLAACAEADDQEALPFEDGTERDPTDTTVPPEVDDAGEVGLAGAVEQTLAEGDAAYTLVAGWGTVHDVARGDAERGTGARATDATDTGEDDATGTAATDDDHADDRGGRGEVQGTVDFENDRRQVTVEVDGDGIDMIVDGRQVYVELPEDFRAAGAAGTGTGATGTGATGTTTDAGDAATTNDDTAADGGTATDGATDATDQTDTDDATATDEDPMTATDDAGWGHVDLSELVDTATNAPVDVLVALHDPGAVLRAVQNGTDTGTETETGTSEELDGRELIRYQVTVEAEDIDDPVFQALADREGFDQVAVHVWVDRDDGNIARMAYDLPAAAATPTDDDTTTTDDDGVTTSDGASDTGDADGTGGRTDTGATGTGTGTGDAGGDADGTGGRTDTGATGTGPTVGIGAQLAVVIDLDQVSGAEAIEVPDRNDVVELEATQLRGLLTEVDLVGGRTDTSRGTSPGTTADDTDAGIGGVRTGTGTGGTGGSGVTGTGGTGGTGTGTGGTGGSGSTGTGATGAGGTGTGGTGVTGAGTDDDS
jgi:hypothetical protein